MNMFKKSMAMFLTLCMLLSMVPMAAFADDTVPAVTEATGETVVETTAATEAAEETTAPTESSEEAPEKNRMAPEEKKAAPGKHKGDHKKPNHDATEPVTEATEEVTEATEDATEPTLDPYGIATMDLEAGIATAAIEVATEPTLDPYGIATMDLEAGIATIAEKPTAPADGTTIGEPFLPEKTAGSYSFRIPALVTLSDGTLVAAADARWNTTYDGGGLDTIVARSSNGGANWSYTFANYLGDNGNEYNGASTCFIDPSLAVYTTDNNNDGIGEDTIYMLCDLYPTGVALNGDKQITPSYTTGFNASGYLKLTTATLYSTSSDYSDSDFTHYLKDGKIYSNDGTEVAGYTVDEYFNLYQNNNTYVSNLFFSDSPYKVARTGFLYLTKSTDKGANWSAPQLLNLKTSSEQVCLVGPGRGLVTSDGTIIFPAYSYKSSGSTEYKYTSLIYSTDNGSTWKRSASVGSPTTTSEATMVELGNGKIRTFFRNELSQLVYADFNLTAGTWGSSVNTGVACNSDTELSAITYSYGVVDAGVEKDVVLVSAPGGPSSLNGTNDNHGNYRSSGKIFMGLINDDYSMTWQTKSVAVTPVATSAFSGDTFTAEQGFFGYSCLTEMYDTGSVAILYEDSQQGWGTGTGYGYTMAFKTYSKDDLANAFGVTFTGDTDVDVDGSEGSDEDATVVEVNLKVGETTTENIDGVALNGSNADDTTSSAIATVTWAGTTAEGGTTEVLTAATLPTSAGSIECYISDGNGNYLSNNGTTLTNATSAANATKWTIIYEDTPNWDTNTNNMSRYNVYTAINGVTYYINGNFELKTSDTNNNFWYTVDNGFFGGFAGTNGWQYANGAWGINSSGYGNANAYNVETVTAEGASVTNVTIEGKAAGNTSVTVGNTTYNITVTADAPTATDTVDVNIKVGETSQVYNNTTGSNIVQNPDNTIATMTVTEVPGVAETTVSTTTATELEAGATYIIRVANTEYALTSNKGGTTWGDSDGDSRSFELYSGAEADNMWTLEASGTGYKLKSAAGYLNLGKNAAWITEDGGDVFTLTYSSDGWAIGDGTYNIDALGGLKAYYCAGGWPNSGTRFDLYKVTTASTGSTEITFQGVSVGTTTAIVGTTQYNITVTAPGMTEVNIEVEIGETFTYTDTTGNHSDKITTQPDGTYATMVVTGVANTTQQKLVPVTAKTFEAGKLYVIENVRTVDPNNGAYQPNDSVLAATEVTGGATGLDMNGPLDVATSQKWSFTPSDNMYFVKANGEYIHISAGNATMESTAQSLSFEYVDGSGWLIYFNADGNNTSDDGDYFLSDVYGTGSGEAFGYTDKDDDGNYWNIYEVVDETTTEATKVAFTGVAAGNTTAIVGNTQYNITVVAREVDDEIMNSATGIWTVDPEVQRNAYNSIVNGKHKDLYTDDSWKTYETARQAAYKKLTEVTNAQYTSQADAEAALAELTTLVGNLKKAADELVSAKTISVRYQLNGSTLDTREYKVTGTDATLTLPSTIVVDNVAYTVNETELTLGVDTTFNVPVTKVGKLGGGFVASADITAGSHNGHEQVTDLVDDTGNKKKITEMTLTVGIEYDLDLATDTRGYAVEWTTGDANFATVDDNGLVTATGEGTTTVVATVKDADGNVVEVNSIPVTVFPKGTGDRNTAIYIEEVTNTTVWCVVNANTDAYAFEVVEGELIYGQFDTTVSDGTKTTAISFFGDPDEAHALVYMKSTNSDDHYFLLHDDDGNLYDGTVTPNDDYYVSGITSGAGWWQAVGLTDNSETNTSERWQKIKDMVQWAINQGCDGGLGFTRRKGEGALASNLKFASDPMPRIEKTVDGVLPTSRMQADYRRYQPGMVAAVHELVYFKITVTQEIPTVWTDDNKNYGAITYSSALITDTILPGAYLYTKELDRADGTYDGEIAVGSRVQEDDITDELNGAWTAEQKAAGKRTFDYYLVYEIQESDIPKFWIDNIANLSYNYSSKYSKGAQAGAADAEARISVVGTAIDDVVIDFGQSFTYAGHKFTSITDNQEHIFEGLRNVHLKGAYVNEKSKATAKYGDVTVNAEQLTDEEGNLVYDDKGYPEYEYTVTYTPTKILQGPDTVLIYGLGENNQEKIINGFVVYPATSVYYEEGFLFETNSGWNTDAAKNATKEQSFELLGMSQFDNNGMLTGKISNKKYNYGYDPLYPITNEGKVADSYAEANEIGDTATFTFTGDGIQIFANSKPTSGYVSVEVKNRAGKIMNLSMVDTATTAGDTSATTGQTGDLNGLPIVSLVDLQNIPHDTYTVTLTKIMEKEPVYITGARVFNTVEDSSVFAIDLEDNPEFYELRDSVLHAVDVNKTASEMYGSDWMDKGSVQIGPLSEQVYGSISTDTEKPVAVVTSVDDIYGTDATAQDLLDNGPKNELYLYGGQTLTFKVNTSRIMQIGLKAPQGATEASIKIGDATTAQDVKSSVDMFYDLVPTATKDGQYTVSITNSGSAILSVTLLKVCDDPSFAFSALTEQDIEDLLVNVYGLSDSETPTVPSEPEELPSEPETEPSEPETKPTEPSKPGKPGNNKPGSNKPGSNKPGNNKPGRPGADTKQAEAVLNIVFINLRGKQVGTATLTETGNAKDRCVFSASEISAQAPARYRALWFTPAIVSYGDTARIIVPVI